MTRILAIVLALLTLCGLSTAQAQIEAYSASVTSISTSTTPTAVTKYGVSGKVLSINAKTDANANIRVRTEAGIGSSLGSSRVILNTNAVTSAGYVSNIADTVYLYNDNLIVEFQSAPSNGVAGNVLVIVQPSP